MRHKSSFGVIYEEAEFVLHKLLWFSGQPLSLTFDAPGGRRYRCKEIGSYPCAQELLRHGHTYLDSNGDGEECESLRR